MLHRKLLILFILFSKISLAQDTAKLEDVVVTATRSERKMGNIAVPVKLISKLNIQQTGSLRLQDILQEQTGLVVVNSSLSGALNGYPNPFGQGIQMLGLDPAYTAILLDGEPLVGRNAGILKLGRLATGNIRQIEIVKGPASCLYGSEAMAGVINILSENPTHQKIDIQQHYSTNNTVASTIAYSNKFNKTGVQFFVNRYSTDGYDLDPKTYGKTVDTYRDWNSQVKINHNFSDKLSYQLSLRMFNQKQFNDYEIYPAGSTTTSNVKGNTLENDYSAFSQLRWKMNENQKLFIRLFYNRYENTASVADNKGINYDETSFLQHILKPEIQYEKNTVKGNKYIAGFGAYFETIDASRYSGNQSLQTVYAFSQKEWNLFKNKHTLIAGVRLDKRNDFDLNFSPRVAWAYKPNDSWKFTASVGGGFKAPDFRHMFLNLSNQQIGYSLIGNNILYPQLTTLKNQGLLDPSSNIDLYANTQSLKPEQSIGMHLGATYKKQNLTATFGIFRNDIDNLIDVYTLNGVLKNNGGSIWSYRNINKVYTQGFEFDIKYNLSKHFEINAGYQYLIAKDKELANKIDEGKVYYRDPSTLQSIQVTQSNYFGLPNRSRNSYNFKLLYTTNNQKFYAFARVVYRGRFGVEGSSGKMIIDNSNDFVDGFFMVNAAAAYHFNKQFQVQVGCDNLTNFTNVLNMPQIAGRLFFININYSLNIKNKN